MGFVRTAMSLRTNQTSGLLTCLFGLIMIGFGLFGLLIVEMQRLILVHFTIPDDRQGLYFKGMLRFLHEVWYTYLPFTIAGGVVFTIAGYYVYRGSTTARRIAQLNCLAGFVWTTLYLASCAALIDQPPPEFAKLPEPIMRVFRWFSLIGGSLMAFSFPTGILWLLSRPRTVLRSLKSEPV